MQMYHISSIRGSCCVGTKKQRQSPHAVTSKVGRRSERLALTQRKQSCHVLTIALATKDVSLVVTHNAALIKTEQAEFKQKIKTKTFPLCLRSAGIQQRLTTPHQSYAKCGWGSSQAKKGWLEMAPLQLSAHFTFAFEVSFPYICFCCFILMQTRRSSTGTATATSSSSTSSPMRRRSSWPTPHL